MNIRILSVIIFVLIISIAGTFLLQKNNDQTIVPVNSDFSIIGIPRPAPPLFTDLLTKTPNNLQQNVLDNVYLDEYYIYPCSYENQNTDVVVLVSKYKQDSSGVNSFIEAQTAFKSYENSIYQDWGHIIFKGSFKPNLEIITFDNESISNSDVLTDSYRVGKLSDNTTKIYYGWVLNYVLVASSKECLLASMESVYDVH
jgi:hypothetical protein